MQTHRRKRRLGQSIIEWVVTFGLICIVMLCAIDTIDQSVDGDSVKQLQTISSHKTACYSKDDKVVCIEILD